MPNEGKTGIILVTGSRTYSNNEEIEKQLWIAINDLYHENYTVIRVRHGGNVYRDRPSADGLAKAYVKRIRPSFLSIGIDLDDDPVLPDWETYGRAAGPIRNHQMVDMGLDIGLVFMEKVATPGTTDCMRYMIQKGHIPRIFREKS